MKAAKKGSRSRKTLEDSDDEVATKKASPKKLAAKKRETTPDGEATNASDYFGNSKPKKSEPVKKSTATKKTAVDTPKASPAKATSAKNTPRTSTRAKPAVKYEEEPVDGKVEAGEDEENDDVFHADFRSNGKGLGDDYEEGDGEEDDVKPARRTAGKGRQATIKDEDEVDPEQEDVDMKDVNADDEFVVPDDDEHIEVDKPAKATKAPATAARKRKSKELDDDDEEDEDDVKPKKVKTTKATTAKKPAPKKAKAEDKAESAEAQAIFDSIPLVRPPTPPPKDGETKKFPFKPGGHANSGPPPGGSIEMPVGAENCLNGLTFVFTGLLQRLAREDGQALVKRYGGKVVGSPSSKTSYVVLGNDAGPKKLEVIAKNGLKTINEEGLFELIRRLPANGGSSAAAAKYEEKKEKEMEKIKQQAAELERAERQAGIAGGGAAPTVRAAKDKAPVAGPDTRLWTVKYAPTQMSQICGNKAQVDKLVKWLREFPKHLKRNFKLAGADGMGMYRAVMIHGPPGIGKTTAAHLAAKLEGFDVVESNASDTRSKKLVESGLKGVLDTTSLLGYFAGDGQDVQSGKKKVCLIMDEVDGMSAGDRGGVGALAAVCKKSKVPMILICNERKLPKMKPFDACTFALPFRRPTTDQIRSRIMTILFREGLKLPTQVVDALIEGTGADIRQIVNMASTVKLDSLSEDAAPMDFDRSKQMSKAWEKSVILRPWDIVGKILGGGMFAQSSKATLNDKIELYFNDHEFSYLMLAENYLGTNPIAAANYSGREERLKKLELADKAANSISEGDLVDRMIHGPEQQWSLMPSHAIMSFVRPASFVSGSMAGHGTTFPQWFGKNSTQGELEIYVALSALLTQLKVNSLA
jgi:replication factor C subunit 1